MSNAKLPHSISRFAGRLARLFPRTLRSLGSKFAFETNAALDDLLALMLAEDYARIIERHPNPLNRAGRRIFSNSDEDGITLEIARRIGIECGVFAEFGVGDGRENNTIALAALGWKGFWAGAQSLAFRAPSAEALGSDFVFLHEFIDRSNIMALTRRGLEAIGEGEVDLVSLDLDGNDYYFVEELLRGGILPKVFVVEYNAKFVPPIRWKIEYDPRHRWSFDDYFGASLAEFCDLFEPHGYFLACCNSGTGANAYFVQSAYRHAFRDVPAEIDALWAPPRYYLPKYGHPVSPKTVASILDNIGAVRERRAGRSADDSVAVK